ncbi:venom allergen 5-like [Sergentomyia squamirostris]
MLKFVLLIAVVCGAAQAIDWCAMKTQYCGPHEHIACEPNSFPKGSNVHDIKQVVISSKVQKMIIERHNMYRRRVASGQEPKLSSASKMKQMSWNNDLAYVANAHAKHANFQNDKCRKFTKFPQSGQSLGITWSSQPFTNFTAALQGLIDEWYNHGMPTIRDKMQTCIKKYTLASPNAPNCREAAPFTVMIKDSNNAVGCAAYTFEQLKDGMWLNTLLITCNYADTNMMNSSIYAKGAACSACTGTCNKSLCA